MWCVRAPKKQAFCTNTSNIGSETYFYRVLELHAQDIAYLRAVISQASAGELRQINEDWIKLFQMPFEIRKLIVDHSMDASTAAQLRTKLDAIEKTMGERYQTGVEEKALPIIELLKNGNATFYDDAGMATDFIHFLVLQYFRTAKMRNAVTGIPLTVPWDPHRTWPIERLIYATNVGASLFADRKRYGISFLENSSPVPFIAGDQPVVNLNPGTDQDLCLFYPVSPTMAVIYAADRDRFPLGISRVTGIEAETYNHRLYAKSDSQIYGIDGTYLEAMACLPKDETLR